MAFSIKTTALENVERDYHAFLQEMSGEESLERYRNEFERLHRALRRSGENEKRLIRRCQELSQEVVANGAKIQTAVKLSQSDQQTIEVLKKEIEKAWKIVDAAREKETKARKTVEQLKAESTRLQLLVEQGTQLTQNHELAVAQLVEEKKALAAEHDSLLLKVSMLTKDMRDASEKLRELENALSSSTTRRDEVLEKLANIKQQTEIENSDKTSVDSRHAKLGTIIVVRDAELEACRTSSARLVAAMTKLQAEYESDNAEMGKNTSALERLVENLAVTRRAQEDFSASLKELVNEAKAREKEEARISHEIISKSQEVQKLIQQHDSSDKIYRGIVQQVHELKKRKEVLMQQVATHEKDEAALRRVLRRTEELHQEHLRHLQKLGKMVDLEKARQQGVQERIDEEKGVQADIAIDIDHQREINTRLHRQLSTLAAERERVSQEASAAIVKHMEVKELAIVQRVKADDLKQQIAEIERRLNERQALFEQVRTDRNSYQKRVTGYQDEVCEMGQKVRTLDQQAEQLQHELEVKVSKLREEQQRQDAGSEQLMKLRSRANDFLASFEQVKARSEELSRGITQLAKTVRECDARLSAQQKSFLSVSSERDILGTQLIRRNDELALLYEKFRIQQMTLNAGEMKYRDRLLDAQSLRTRLRELAHEQKIASRGAHDHERLQMQVAEMQNRLLLERRKVQVLSEELENSQNLLRWRPLGGTDPSWEQMMQKIQRLQRQFIAKAEDAVEKEIILQEMGELFAELKSIIEQQPGAELVEQLNLYQSALRRKNASMRALAGELNMASAEISESQYETERLRREINGTQKMFLDLKATNDMYLDKDVLGGKESIPQVV